MASNLECVGLELEGKPWKKLLREVERDGSELGRLAGTTVLRWEDPSGARLLLEIWNHTVVNVLPSYAGRPAVRLSDVQAYGSDLFVANAVDEDGTKLARLAIELEQRPLYAEASKPVDEVAALVGLGVDVDVRPGPTAEVGGSEELEESGIEWTDAERRRVGSLKCPGVTAAPELAEPTGQLTGTVLGAEVLRVEATAQKFVVARVATAGFELDVCMPAEEFEEYPQAGDEIEGTVFLVACLTPGEPVVQQGAALAAQQEAVAERSDDNQGDNEDGPDNNNQGGNPDDGSAEADPNERGGSDGQDGQEEHPRDEADHNGARSNDGDSKDHAFQEDADAGVRAAAPIGRGNPKRTDSVATGPGRRPWWRRLLGSSDEPG